MGVPSELELDKETFVRAAMELFTCDRATAERLVPMVASLRSLARRVSATARTYDFSKLSESATGD